MNLVETVNITAQIFTALGTVGAVIVSLWLALRSQRIKAKAIIGFKTIYLPSDSDPSIYKPNDDIFEVTVTNTGVKPFKIHNIAAYDKQLKHWLIISPDYAHPFCTKSGYVYSESETGRYIFPKDAFAKSLKDALNITGSNSIKRLKKLKFVATTNLGQNISVIPDKSFYQDCNELFNKSN